MKMEKVVVKKMSNGGIIRLLDRGKLMPYCFHWDSREFSAGELGNVVVNLMWKEA